MAILASTFRWLQRKRYQYEVTFSLYMLTPTEKFIFNSFIFLFFSMVLIAASLYLPQHITFLTNRAWFYYHGDETLATAAASTAVNIASAAKATNAVPGMPENFVNAGRKAGSAKGWNQGEL